MRDITTNLPTFLVVSLRMEHTTSPGAVLDRLKQATTAKSDTDLARILGVTQQSVSNARANNKVPDSWIRIAAQKYGLSADWLLFSVGTSLIGDSQPQGEEAGRVDGDDKDSRISELEKELASARKAENAALKEATRAYRLIAYLRLPEETLQKLGLPLDVEQMLDLPLGAKVTANTDNNGK